MKNLNIDIWTLKDGYILGVNPYGERIEIDCTEALVKRHKNRYWEWPLHFAEKEWCTEENAISLLKIINIVGSSDVIQSKGRHHKDIDKNTIEEVRSIIKDKT